jgi:hypothetical protein
MQQGCLSDGSKTPGCRMHSVPILLGRQGSRIFWRMEERFKWRSGSLGHADSRTTKLYDRRGQKVLLEDMDSILKIDPKFRGTNLGVTFRIIWRKILLDIWHNDEFFGRASWTNSHPCRNRHVSWHSSAFELFSPKFGNTMILAILPTPAADFRPIDATEADLVKHGFPPRPTHRAETRLGRMWDVDRNIRGRVHFTAGANARSGVSGD